MDFHVSNSHPVTSWILLPLHHKVEFFGLLEFYSISELYLHWTLIPRGYFPICTLMATRNQDVCFFFLHIVILLSACPSLSFSCNLSPPIKMNKLSLNGIVLRRVMSSSMSSVEKSLELLLALLQLYLAHNFVQLKVWASNVILFLPVRINELFFNGIVLTWA